MLATWHKTIRINDILCIWQFFGQHAPEIYLARIPALYIIMCNQAKQGLMQHDEQTKCKQQTSY